MSRAPMAKDVNDMLSFNADFNCPWVTGTYKHVTKSQDNISFMSLVIGVCDIAGICHLINFIYFGILMSHCLIFI